MEYILTERRDARIRLYGQYDEAIRTVENGLYRQLDFLELTSFFREHSDPFAAGEFWGKIMRGAVLCWQYTRSLWLKEKMDAAVRDLLSCRSSNGCISTVPTENQPGGANGSDLWERKYVMLGLISYYQAFGGENVLNALMAEADVLLEQVGAPPKKPITEIGYAFFGIESSSILDPIMKLYNITKEPRYLRFARYIVEEAGGCARGSIFEAVENGTNPMDVGSNGNPKESICKAYEMMSCFEGLVQYAVATDSERWKKTAVLFWEKVRDQEITLLGSGGADGPFNLGPGDGEQWNGSAREQSNPDINLTMETCVTITWMKLCGEIHRLTGRVDAYDELERGSRNALLGAMRPDGCFFDYFQRFNGTRNNKVNFNFDFGDFPLSCCTANGPAGLCRVPFFGFSRADNALYVSLFADARYEDENFALRVETGYPLRGDVRITVERAPEQASILAVRVPSWARKPRAARNETALTPESGSYLTVPAVWRPNDVLRLTFDLPVVAVPAPHSSNPAGNDFTAYTLGTLVLARDRRFDPAFDQPVPAASGEQPCSLVRLPGARLALRVGEMTLIDYPSAGATWDEKSEFRCWIPNADPGKTGNVPDGTAPE